MPSIAKRSRPMRGRSDEVDAVQNVRRPAWAQRRRDRPPRWRQSRYVRLDSRFALSHCGEGDGWDRRDQRRGMLARCLWSGDGNCARLTTTTALDDGLGPLVVGRWTTAGLPCLENDRAPQEAPPAEDDRAEKRDRQQGGEGSLQDATDHASTVPAHRRGANRGRIRSRVVAWFVQSGGCVTKGPRRAHARDKSIGLARPTPIERADRPSSDEG